MELTILKENLQKACSFVGKNISTRTQLPVLSNVLLQTDQGRLKLSTTNLETSMSVWIGATIVREGNITVPARLFTELVASFTGDKVNLKAEQAALELICGESKASLTGIEGSELPPLPPTAGKPQITIDRKNLEQGLSLVTIAASNDESRPLLTGVKFVPRENSLDLVATDGYRLSVKKLPFKSDKTNFVVSSRALLETLRLAKDGNAQTLELFLSADGNQVIFNLPQAQVATRLIEGEYPTYEKIIPSNFTTRAIFNREELLAAIKFAAVYAKESANIIKLNIDKETTVTANAPQIGENLTKVATKLEGNQVEVAFNARFLQDLLTIFPEEELAFEIGGPLSPGVFKPVADDSFLHIIMPVRVQN